MKLRLLRDDVLIERLPDRKVTAGGIHIPQRAVEDAWMRGLVVSTGPENHDVKKGDRVVFAADERYLRQQMFDGKIIVKGDRVALVQE